MTASEQAHDAARLEVLSLTLAELERHPDLIGDVYRRRHLGAIVQGVFAAADMAALAARLTAGVEGMPRAFAHTFKGGLFGSPLAVSGEDLGDYLDAAARFRAAIAPLFAAAGGLEARLEAVLGRITGGCPVEIARAPDGRPYLPASVRMLIEGDALPIHYENGTLRAASLRQLRPALDAETLMSFYVPVALPEAGGILQVFTTDCSGDGDRIIGDLGGPEHARAVLAARGCVDVRPGVGDMLIFDGGRHYHLVTEITRGVRWTLGGFLAYTRDHDRLLYWS